MLRNILFILLFCVLSISSLALRNFSDILSRGMNEHFSAESIFNALKQESDFVSEQVVASTVYTSLDRIEGLKSLENSQVRDIFGIYEGMEIKPEILANLGAKIKASPWVESYTFSKQVFPQRLKINIVEAEPAFVAEYEGDSWIVSKKGVLIQPVREIVKPSLVMQVSELPRVYGIDPKEDNKSYLSSVYDRLSYILKNLEFVDLAGGFPFKYSSLSLINGGGIELEPVALEQAELEQVKLEQRAELSAVRKLPKKVLFQLRSLEEAQNMLSHLKTVLEDIRLRGETPEELDLRFKDQVVLR